MCLVCEWNLGLILNCGFHIRNTIPTSVTDTYIYFVYCYGQIHLYNDLKVIFKKVRNVARPQ